MCHACPKRFFGAACAASASRHAAPCTARRLPAWWHALPSMPCIDMHASGGKFACFQRGDEWRLGEGGGAGMGWRGDISSNAHACSVAPVAYASLRPTPVPCLPWAVVCRPVHHHSPPPHHHPHTPPCCGPFAPFQKIPTHALSPARALLSAWPASSRKTPCWRSSSRTWPCERGRVALADRRLHFAVRRGRLAAGALWPGELHGRAGPGRVPGGGPLLA